MPLDKRRFIREILGGQMYRSPEVRESAWFNCAVDGAQFSVQEFQKLSTVWGSYRSLASLLAFLLASILLPNFSVAFLLAFLLHSLFAFSGGFSFASLVEPPPPPTSRCAWRYG